MSRTIREAGALTRSKLFEENSETPFASLTQLAVAVIVHIIMNGTAGTLLRIRQGKTMQYFTTLLLETNSKRNISFT